MNDKALTTSEQILSSLLIVATCLLGIAIVLIVSFKNEMDHIISVHNAEMDLKDQTINHLHDKLETEYDKYQLELQKINTQHALDMKNYAESLLKKGGR